MEDIFIGYKGNEFSKEDIRKELHSEAIKLGKKDYYLEDKDLFLGSTNGYNVDLDYTLPSKMELDDVYYYVADNKNDFFMNDVLLRHAFHEFFIYAVNLYHFFAFRKMLEHNFEFSYLIYNKNKDEFKVVKLGDDKKLYYAYTPLNKEIIFSNSNLILEKLCDQVFEFPNNHFYENGKFESINLYENNIRKRI